MIGTIESFEQVTLPVCAVNFNQRIVVWNKAAEEFFGFEADGVLGRDWHSVIRTQNAQDCCGLCRARRSLREGKPAGPAESTVCIDGYQHLVTMVPIPFGSGADLMMAFIMFTADTLHAASGARSKTPIPINSRVRYLSDDRMIETLTQREREVLACVVEGYDARTIADTIGITHATARNYVQRILTKLGARNKAEAVNVALRYNLLAS